MGTDARDISEEVCQKFRASNQTGIEHDTLSRGHTSPAQIQIFDRPHADLIASEGLVLAPEAVDRCTDCRDWVAMAS